MPPSPRQTSICVWTKISDFEHGEPVYECKREACDSVAAGGGVQWAWSMLFLSLRLLPLFLLLILFWLRLGVIGKWNLSCWKADTKLEMAVAQVWRSEWRGLRRMDCGVLSGRRVEEELEEVNEDDGGPLQPEINK